MKKFIKLHSMHYGNVCYFNVNNIESFGKYGTTNSLVFMVNKDKPMYIIESVEQILEMIEEKTINKKTFNTREK